MSDDRLTRDMRQRRAFAAISEACQKTGLTQSEAAFVAVQFAGMVVAMSPHPVTHDVQLDVLAQAMRNQHGVFMARRIA